MEARKYLRRRAEMLDDSAHHYGVVGSRLQRQVINVEVSGNEAAGRTRPVKLFHKVGATLHARIRLVRREPGHKRAVAAAEVEDGSPDVSLYLRKSPAL